jgi:hypothetical protein
MRTIALAVASLIALAGPSAAQQQQPAQESSPPDCRALQPDQCVNTCGCVWYEHAKAPSCRGVKERIRSDEMFDPRSTMVVWGKCPPSNR